MLYQGKFLDIRGRECEVLILTAGDRSTVTEIGRDGGALYFDEDPVEIQRGTGNTRDVLQTATATVRIQAGDFYPDLFAADPRDVVVNIYVGGVCEFAGFVEPQAYSQDFNGVADTLELSCIDAVAALSTRKWRGVDNPAVDYDALRAEAAGVSFAHVIRDALDPFVQVLDIKHGNGVDTVYDGSRQVTPSWGNESPDPRILTALHVSELLFYGKDREGAWTSDTAVTAVLKYLNLHLEQRGLTFYVYHWSSARRATEVEWRNIYTGQPVGLDTAVSVRILATDIVAGDSAQLNVSEAYSTVELTANAEPLEEIVGSPMGDDLRNVYTSRPRYMVERSCLKAKDKDNQTIEVFVGGPTGAWVPPLEKGCKEVSWYVQPRTHKHWQFRAAISKETEAFDPYERWAQPDDDPRQLGMQLRDEDHYTGQQPLMGAVLLTWASSEKALDGTDNEPKATLDTKDTMTIIVNGIGGTADGKTIPADDERTNVQRQQNMLLRAAPVARYTGPRIGAPLMGALLDYTVQAKHYIVISGELALNPVMATTRASKSGAQYEYKPSNYNACASSEEERGRWYSQRYLLAPDGGYPQGIYPFTGEGERYYKFAGSTRYSKNPIDTVHLVKVLRCMLIIGGKYWDGASWRPYKPEAQCADRAEWLKQSFSIGFNPKIDSWIVGEKHSIANTIKPDMCIEAEGTAIPMDNYGMATMASQVGVEFLILGPDTAEVGIEETKGADPVTRYAMAYVHSIEITDLSITIHSDNGGRLLKGGDNQVVYKSDKATGFVNPLDGETMDVCSALTAEEAEELDVRSATSLSTVYTLNPTTPVVSVYDTATPETAKPEVLWVAETHEEFSKPRITLDMELETSATGPRGAYRYHHAALGKDFYPIAETINVRACTSRATLKETF